MMERKRRLSKIVAFSIALALLASCASPAGIYQPRGQQPRGQQTLGQQTGADIDLRSRLTAANLLAGSLAQGLDSAIRTHAVTPGSERAALIAATLGAVERSLDGAGAALRAGLPDLATRQVGAAELQLDGLQPLLPIQHQPESTEDVP